MTNKLGLIIMITLLICLIILYMIYSTIMKSKPIKTLPEGINAEVYPQNDHNN